MYVGNPGTPNGNNIMRCTIVDRALGTVNSCTSVSGVSGWGLIAGKTNNTFIATTTSSDNVRGLLINDAGGLTSAGSTLVSGSGFAGLVWAP